MRAFCFLLLACASDAKKSHKHAHPKLERSVEHPKLERLGQVQTRWTTKQWRGTKDGKIVVSLDELQKRGRQAPGPEEKQWFATQDPPLLSVSNEKPRSWAMAETKNGIPVMLFSQEAHSGTDVPSHDAQVAAFVLDHTSGEGTQQLERGTGTITLAPFRPKDPPLMSDADADDESDGEYLQMLQVGEQMYPWFHPAFVMPYMAYGSLVAATGLAMFGAAAASTTSTDLERYFEDLPSLEVKLHSRKHAVTVRHPADLEIFAPAVAASLFFYPWGLAFNGAYFAAGVAAATFGAATGLYPPAYPYPIPEIYKEAAMAVPKWWMGSVKAGTEWTKGVVQSYKGAVDAHADNIKAAVDTGVQLSAPLYPYFQQPLAPQDLTAAFWNWMWGAAWWWHLLSYAYLFWQMRWMMWHYWTQMGLPNTLEATKDTWAFWAKMYTAYWEYWGKVYAYWAKAYKASWEHWASVWGGKAASAKKATLDLAAEMRSRSSEKAKAASDFWAKMQKPK